MKILHVITGLDTGGAERAIYNVLAGGLAKRHDIYVLSLTDEATYGSRIRALGVQVSALNMKRGLPTFTVIWQLRKVVQEFNPDIIQGWMYHGNLAASLACRFAPGCPALVWNVRHSLYDLAFEKVLTRLVIRVNRWLSHRIDTVIYNSRVSREQHETFGFDRSRGRVIPNGFNLEILKPDVDAGVIIRQELGIRDGALVIGHVARFHPMKDHASFLRAAVSVATVIPSAHFLVVGRGVSLDNPVLAEIVPPEFIDRFTFPGERSDIHRMMQSMDIFCQSSWSEAFPNVLGEAMSCGVTCVTTDVGDSSDIIGDTGIVVPPSNSEALARGLITMLEMPNARRLELGRAARERVKSEYGLESVVEQYVTLYETLTERGGK